MENSVQKLIEEIAQIAEKYDVTSRCVLDIRRLKERFPNHFIMELDSEGNIVVGMNPREWRGVIAVLPDGGKIPLNVEPKE